MNMAAINQSQTKDTLSEMENRDLTKFMAEQLEEKCESVNHVNDDGSIDCPKKRSNAIRKIGKFHNDKHQNEGCKDYAREQMVKYNQTCYGDDTNTDRKWDKNDTNYRNVQAEQSGFYNEQLRTSANFSEEKKIPSTCKKPSKNMVCRYCQAKGVIDPKCKCCPGTDMANAAIKKEQEQLTLRNGSVNPSPRDLVAPQKEQLRPVIHKLEDNTIQPDVVTPPVSEFSESDKNFALIK